MITATIRDVAKRAGVSVATVSRVVNASAHRVHPATRRRVLAAVTELRYHTNVIAQGLKKGTSRTIALIVPDISNPFYPAIARGIEDVATAHGYAVLLCDTYEDLAKEQAHLQVLRKRWIDGLVFATVGSNTTHLRALVRDRVPVVLVARTVDGLPIDAVFVDNYQGAFIAATHLLGLGHQRIAFIGGPSTLRVTLERRRGYEAALKAAGIPADPRLLAEGDFTIDGGHRAMRRLLEFSIEFDSVLAANDLMAIGAMEALRAAGRRVPHDVALVGFDDIAFASLVSPPLTTVAQPKYEMGRLAMERLLELMNGSTSRGQQIILAPDLVIRESCGAASVQVPGRHPHPSSAEMHTDRSLGVVLGADRPRREERT